MGTAVEPSVEEILESIKKVMARDNHVGAEEERRPSETSGAAPESASAAQDDILDLADAAELTEPAPASDPNDGETKRLSPLIAEDTRSSISDSLAALAMLAEPGAPPQIVRSGETSLEGMARDLLRPALTDWLEKNLPTLVERMVAAEIARIVGKKG